MELTRNFDDALQWAADLHRFQERKGTGIPYVSHLLSVASLVLEYGGDEDQAIAALLHDSIEDQGVTEDQIAQRYGTRVAAIVRACTDSETIPKPPWKQRKREYIEHLPKVPADVLLVSLADKTHNARAIAADVAREGERYFERFAGGADGTRWYYRRLADVFESCADDLRRSGSGADGTHLLAEYLRVIEVFGATAAAADSFDSQ